MNFDIICPYCNAGLMIAPWTKHDSDKRVLFDRECDHCHKILTVKVEMRKAFHAEKKKV